MQPAEAFRPLYRTWPLVPVCHTSVSGWHSDSAFGDEESIDKKSPKISKTATIAPASITRPHLLTI
jgi:hypothetical protein